MLDDSSITVNLVYTYLNDLKNKIMMEVGDQKNLVLLMKNIIDFLDLENFCKNNLNDFSRYED